MQMENKMIVSESRADRFVGMTVRTRDMAACRRFYEAMGLLVEYRDGAPSTAGLLIDLGGITMSVLPCSPFHPASASPDIAIVVDDLKGRVADAEYVLSPSKEPTTPLGRNAMFRDPDGRLVKLTDEMQ